VFSNDQRRLHAPRRDHGSDTSPSPFQATTKPGIRWWAHLEHREGRNLAVIVIDLIGFLLPSKGNHALTAAGGAG
jgi:hypothetical protein